MHTLLVLLKLFKKEDEQFFSCKNYLNNESTLPFLTLQVLLLLFDISAGEIIIFTPYSFKGI